jgi:hypothetical protein
MLGAHCGSLRPNGIEPGPQRRPLAYVIDLVHQADREFLARCPGPQFATELTGADADALCINNVPAVLASLTGTSARARSREAEHKPPAWRAGQHQAGEQRWCSLCPAPQQFARLCRWAGRVAAVGTLSRVGVGVPERALASGRNPLGGDGPGSA